MTKDLPFISIVVPVFDEDESLEELNLWIRRVLDGEPNPYEIIFVDDGSTDNSWKVLINLATNDERIKVIRFSRNYGKSAALTQGFKVSKGDIVITMDADLQDSPDEIPELVRMISEEEYDLVSGWKKKRHDPLEKKIPSKLFNRTTRLISGIKLHDFNCGLKAYKGDVVKNITVYGERHRYIPLLVKWAGFRKIGEKVVKHHPRKYGHTKFGMSRYLTGFLDLLSISFVTRFLRNPMHFFGGLGSISFMAGFGITVFVIGEKLYKQYHSLPVRDVTDQPLFFLALVALIIGSQLFLSGFLAELITRNSPDRDNYTVSESRNLD